MTTGAAITTTTTTKPRLRYPVSTRALIDGEYSRDCMGKALDDVAPTEHEHKLKLEF